jgi:hypothetical protein
MHSLGDYVGERGRLARGFWRPAKNLQPSEHLCVLQTFGIVSCKAHDTADEAPALPKSCGIVFIQHEGQ